MTGFQRAVKEQLKARVALEGPTGSGKTWTALQWATTLADGGPIAVIDTEYRSASHYADTYQFDVLDWQPPYDLARLATTIRDAGRDYTVLIIDSFTHFWNGEGGTIDLADKAGKRSGGNSFAGWKTATPAFRHVIDTILGSPAHVICTMRSKMEYILEEGTGRDGRKTSVPRKVGMAPEMRAGVEYEFTVVGELDVEHNLAITKSRCSLIADQTAQPHRAGELAATFAAWLDTGVAAPPPPPAEPLIEAIAGLTAARGLGGQPYPSQPAAAKSTPASRYHKRAAAMGLSEDDRRSLIWLASQGHTDSAGEAESGQIDQAIDWAKLVNQGQATLDTSRAGGARLVALLHPNGDDIARWEAPEAGDDV